MIVEENQLFENDFFPEFIAQESLYSWCARVHQISCNSSAQRTSRQLFGHPKSGLRIDFPTPLATLVSNTSSVLGNPKNLLSERTLYGFYEQFLPKDRREALSSAVIDGPYSLVHHSLGLSASLSRQFRDLKCCLVCLAEKRNSNFGWWKIRDQWPTSFVCEFHDRVLDSLTEELTSQLNSDWFLPNHITDRNGWRNQIVVSALTLNRLKSISCWSEDILRTANLDLDTNTLRYCYLMQAKERGLISKNGTLRLGILRNAWLKWSEGIAGVAALRFVKEVVGTNAGFIGQLTHMYPGIRHPLKHFLLIAYLFDNFEAFKFQNEFVSRTLSVEGDAAIANHLRANGQITSSNK